MIPLVRSSDVVKIRTKFIVLHGHMGDMTPVAVSAKCEWRQIVNLPLATAEVKEIEHHIYTYIYVDHVNVPLGPLGRI